MHLNLPILKVIPIHRQRQPASFSLIYGQQPRQQWQEQATAWKDLDKWPRLVLVKEPLETAVVTPMTITLKTGMYLVGLRMRMEASRIKQVNLLTERIKHGKRKHALYLVVRKYALQLHVFICQGCQLGNIHWNVCFFRYFNWSQLLISRDIYLVQKEQVLQHHFN